MADLPSSASRRPFGPRRPAALSLVALTSAATLALQSPPDAGAAAVTAALVEPAAQVSPAGAQREVAVDGTISIVSIPTQRVAIHTSTCRDVPVQAVLGTGVTTGDPSPRNIVALGEMDVSSQDSAPDTAHMGAGGDVTGKPTIAMPGEFFWCPHLDGLGWFNLGPTQLNAQVDDGNAVLYSTNGLDFQTGVLLIRQDSVTGLKIRKVRGQPAVRKFRMSPRYYSIDASGWVRWKKKRVDLQKRVGSTWRTVRTVKTGSTGTAIFTLRAKSGKAFRAVCRGNAKTWDSTSATKIAP